MSTVKETVAGEFGEGEADRLAGGANHVRQKLMCQWKVNSHSAWNYMAICPTELEKLLADTIAVTDVGTGTDGLLSLSQRLGQCSGDRLRHDWKPEESLQRIGRDGCDPRLRESLYLFPERWRGEERSRLGSSQDDPTTSVGVAASSAAFVGHACADQDEALLDGQQGHIRNWHRPPYRPSRQDNRYGPPGDLHGPLPADLSQPTKSIPRVNGTLGGQRPRFGRRTWQRLTHRAAIGPADLPDRRLRRRECLRLSLGYPLLSTCAQPQKESSMNSQFTTETQEYVTEITARIPPPA
jgi:hypothetical protein